LLAIIFGAIISRSIWHIPIIVFINIIVCRVLFGRTFRKALKGISPDSYDYLYGDPFDGNTTKVILFASENVNDASELRKMRQYYRGFLILHTVILFAPFILLVATVLI